MKQYNKQFEYDNMKFNISVTLNHTVEKCIDGKTYHQIVTNCLGHDQYYIKSYPNATSDLKEVIELEEAKVRAYVDKKFNTLNTSEEQLLIDLGFK
jgi:hypothetical protein